MIIMLTSSIYHTMRKQKNHWLSTLLAAALIVVGVLGVCFGMEQYFSSEMMNDNMAACPVMMMQPTLCPMNTLDHITAWQQFLAAIPVSEFTLLLILLAFGLASVYVKLRQRVCAAADILLHYCHHLARQHPHQRLYNYLLSVFSQGIIQPKIYA